MYDDARGSRLFVGPELAPAAVMEKENRTSASFIAAALNRKPTWLGGNLRFWPLWSLRGVLACHGGVSFSFLRHFTPGVGRSKFATRGGQINLENVGIVNRL